MRFIKISILLLMPASLGINQTANLSWGELNQETQTIEVLLLNDTIVGGVQFQTSGIEFTSASGGFSNEYGWMLEMGWTGLFLGFSFESNLVPPSTGHRLLANLHYTTLPEDLSDIELYDAVVAGAPGQPQLLPTYGSCDDLESTYFGENYCGSGCSDPLACNY
ncbi:MAG: hypothetical protein H8D46_00190, partial [FCB group bacterium]|nr:hypothetical protein [FCB group bacterium]